MSTASLDTSGAAESGERPDSPHQAAGSPSLVLRQLGEQPYELVWRAMQNFTAQRQTDTADEIWVLSHPPVFTQGQAGKAEHVLNPGDIPIVQIDRGGQVTYHGPGQTVMYLLVDLRRSGVGVRDLVTLIENSIIATLREFGVNSTARSTAPGVYVDGAKIAALGLRVRRGCSYHGLSVNVLMDLSPFSRINPCGYQGMQVAQLSDFVQGDRKSLMQQLEKALADKLIPRLSGGGAVEHSRRLPTLAENSQ